VNWRDHAACQEADPELLFPTTRTEADAATARAWCNVCPVTAACLAYAVEHGRYGVWGGTTEQERRLAAREAS
jgi:WhiB family redox-sensing transcriptional regulator